MDLGEQFEGSPHWETGEWPTWGGPSSSLPAYLTTTELLYRKLVQISPKYDDQIILIKHRPPNH